MTTLRYAARIGVPRVVFHLGTLGLSDLYRDVLGGASGARDRYRKAREFEADRRRDWLLAAVDTMVAGAQGIEICVENRYHFDQVPNTDDVRMLAEQFPELSYWHDTGHEAAQSHLGLVDDGIPTDLAQRLAGLHVHDCAGVDDHRPPGEGTYSFRKLAPWLRPGMPLVWELDPAADASRIRTGRRSFTDQINGRREHA